MAGPEILRSLGEMPEVEIAAVVSSREAALTAYGAQAGPHAKDLYESGTIFPLVTSAAPLATAMFALPTWRGRMPWSA